MDRAGAQAAKDILVEVNATASATSPHIVLDWPAITNVNGMPSTRPLYRREKGASSWTLQTNLLSSATDYSDSTSEPGVTYEYSVRFNRSVAPEKVYGAIVAGHNIPLVEQRGKVLLVVDDTLAAPLAAELTQLQADLVADGWVVFRLDTPREQYANGAIDPGLYDDRLLERQNLRTAIAGYYNSDSSANWALLIIGHVPVVYSGNLNPDGHGEHLGAWPTDSYYADVNGTWTDSTVNSSAAGARPETINVPGDGKFDQSIIPSFLEFQTGRVDLYNMTAATPAGMNEVELLRQYLGRDHRFRVKGEYYENVARRMIVDDNFGYRDGEAFAASGWRTGINLFGRDTNQVAAADWFDTLQEEPMLMAYGCGNGWYSSADGVGFTSDFATDDSKAVFTMLFGSFFGDWDTADAFLKAPLAGTSLSLGLSCIWSGRPWTHLNHMALGETLGYGVRYTQNTYNQTGGWYQNDLGVGYFYNWIHIGLMGDPTLRLHSMQPVTGLTALSTASGVELSWTASADATAGYHVYRASSPAGPFTRKSGVIASGANPTGTPLITTSFIDTDVSSGQSYSYLVKAVRMETTPSGTYANQSLGTATSHNFTHVDVPQNLVADPGTTPGDIQLSWSPVPDATSYELERSTSSGSGFSNIAILSAPIVNYTDTGLTPNLTYYYRVRAQEGPDYSAYSAEDSAQPYLPATLAGWRYLHFLTNSPTGDAANDADPDEDSLVNLAEYVTGGDPHEPYTVPPVVASIEDDSGTPRLTLTFIHNKAADDPDLDLFVKAADTINGSPIDIDPLSPINQLQVLDDTPAAGLETITVKDVQAVSASSERFMRLSVEQDDPP